MSRKIVNKAIVLQLNANWQPIGVKSVAEAFIAMTSEGTQPSALALDIEYSQRNDGSYDYSNPTYINAVGWSEWVKLPIRDYDLSVRTAKMEVRAPTVLVAPGYRRMPTRMPTLSRQNIYERDGGQCQYTGKKLNSNECNLDHVIPRSKGGSNTWENLVLCDPDVNSKKGNRFNHEVGLKLSKIPKAPKAAPLSAFINQAKHHTWSHFIIEQEKS